MRKLILTAICGFACFTPAFASGLTASQTVQKEIVVKNEDGTTETKYVAAERIAPGESVLYSLNISNSGVQPATNLVMVMPVPSEVKYIDGSADKYGSSVTYSVDGGQSFSTMESLQVVNDDGRSKAASAEDITHIRWEVAGPIEAGTSDVLSFKGRIK